MTKAISADALIENAIKTSGLDDFGGDSFKEGLGAFIHSLNHDLQLSEMSTQIFKGMITQVLVNRLEVEKLIRNHPEILNEKIEAPIFIMGLPRSSTTIIQMLLALDPCSRYLRNWETTQAICPPPEMIHSAQDPVEAVRTIYNHFDLPLGNGHLKRMKVWLRDNPRSRFGNHDPADETFNLNPDSLNEKFHDYRQQFNV